MKKTFVLILLLVSGIVNAQQPKRHKIAIFTPLYLDTAFGASGNFRYNEKNYGKIFNAGLDFYLGAQMALDSLQKRGALLDVYVYDSKARQGITQQLARPEMRDVELMIGSSTAAETRQLADVASRKKVPFISATLPNDAGVQNNPYFVVLNSSIQSHVEGIYQFLQKYHAADNIIVFRKNGGMEDQLKAYFSNFGRTTAAKPLNIRYADIGNGFSTLQVASFLDSTRKNICIAGSLDEGFGNRLATVLSSLNNTYPVTAVGMPTWENLNFNKMTGLEVIYTTPFYYNRQTPLETQLSNEYVSKMSTRPSDMFYRGYETTLRFALLLLDTKKDVASNLTRSGNTVFTLFDIQPVFKNRNDMNLDYFENKHLYFIKALGGVKNILY